MIQSKSSPFSKALALVCSGLFCSAAAAQELGEGVQAHGFISQSLVYTSDNDVGGESNDNLATDMRELGANLSWRPNPDWLVSGQVLARWAGESDQGKFRLDYGFIDHTLYANGEDQIGVRVGKIKNPIGFFNTTRDVAHTRPGVIMPQSIYLDRVRNFFLAAPGISFYGNQEGPDSSIAWQLSTLRPEVEDPDLTYFMVAANTGHFGGKNSWLGQVMLESAGSQWRAGLSLGEIAMAYLPGLPIDPYLAGNHRLPTWVLSVEHNTENWTATAEYSQTDVVARGYGASPLASLIQNVNTTEAWYVQLTRRFSPGWQGFLRYDALYLDKDDRYGKVFAQKPIALFANIPAHHRYAKDWTLGVRRDFNDLMLSLEWHNINGTAWISQLDTPTNTSSCNWDMILLQAAWRF